MPNHQSNFDIPVLLGHLNVQFRWLAKVELFKIPIFGYAMKRAGYISIDRSNRKSAFKSLKRAAKIIREGVSVLIFPEGTRNKESNIGLFKKGGFVLAVDSGVPIVPVIIHGTRAIMPKKKLLIRPKDVILEIKKPIETRDYTRKTKEDLMEKVRQTISGSFERGKRYNP
jgi:1-acyl-sn-glycerol-3-phosphate acyltransferase